MPHTVTVGFEHGTGGLVHYVTGELVASADLDPHAEPSLILTKARSTTWTQLSRDPRTLVEIPLARIVSTQCGGRDV